MEPSDRPRQPFMPQNQAVSASSRTLITSIKSAYWVALLIIAAMAMASFLLLQQMMAAQKRDDAILSLASTQKALSQRVVFLARGDLDVPRNEQLTLVAALRKAVGEFETNYDLLLEKTGADPSSPARFDPKSIESVLFAKPYHLDSFSIESGGQWLALCIRAGNRTGCVRRIVSRRQGTRDPRRDRRQRHAQGLHRAQRPHQRACRGAARQHAVAPPHAVLCHHRHHHPGRAVHFPADVGRHPAQDPRTHGRPQLHGLPRRP